MGSSLTAQTYRPHLHRADDLCPLCEQPIPHETYDRIVAKGREREAELTARLQQQFAKQQAHERALSQAEIEQLKREALVVAQAAREEGRAAAAAEIERLRADSLAALHEVRQQAELKEQLARAEAQNAARAELTAADAARKLAEEKALAAQAAIIGEREALQKAAHKALQDAQAAFFNEKQRLEANLQDLTRQLQSKSTEELGEAAELDLAKLLAEAFPEDKITRIQKGAAGADTRHDVYRNGKFCGRILYESKNTQAWRGDYVAKLRQDKMSDAADHAILSTNKLPAGEKHLCLREGIIVCQPGRVEVLAQMLRAHVLQLASLALSNESRSAKTDLLYDFITSERCGQLLHEMRLHVDGLSKLDEDEVAAHNRTWKKRREALLKITKSHSDLRFEIDGIIGTAGPASDADETA